MPGTALIPGRGYKSINVLTHCPRGRNFNSWLGNLSKSQNGIQFLLPPQSVRSSEILLEGVCVDCSRDVFKNLHQLSHWCPIAPSSAKKWKGPLPPSKVLWGGGCAGVCVFGGQGGSTVIGW